MGKGLINSVYLFFSGYADENLWANSTVGYLQVQLSVYVNYVAVIWTGIYTNSLYDWQVGCTPSVNICTMIWLCIQYYSIKIDVNGLPSTNPCINKAIHMLLMHRFDT